MGAISVLAKLVVALLLLSVSNAGQQQPNCDRDSDAQVLILGAGMAGLGAARKFSESGITDFLILEQRDQIGGRVQSIQFGGTTIELGPQWVLNADPTVPEEIQQPLWPLVQKCNVSLREAPLFTLPNRFYTSDGEDISTSPELISAMQRYMGALQRTSQVLAGLREGQDLTVAGALREGGWSPRTRIEEAVEYFLFDIGLARPSDISGFRDLFDPAITSLPQRFGQNLQSYVVTDSRGYIAIADCLADEFLAPNDQRLILETTVSTVAWGDECVCVMTTKDEEEREYCAPYAILTFSVGEIVNNVVTFIPELPLAKRLEMQRLEMANFLKIYVEFNETFWDTGVESINVVDELNGHEYYPFFIPWGDYFPHKPPILQAFLTGDTALRVAYQDLEITKEQIAEVMRNVYGEKASDPVDIVMHDFIVNRYFFGDFSSVTPGVSDNTFEELNHPIGQLYLAGEAYIKGLHSNTHGVLIHGSSVAEIIAREIQGPLTSMYLIVVFDAIIQFCLLL